MLRGDCILDRLARGRWSPLTKDEKAEEEEEVRNHARLSMNTYETEEHTFVFTYFLFLRKLVPYDTKSKLPYLFFRSAEICFIESVGGDTFLENFFFRQSFFVLISDKKKFS